jgi:hypothetical protein
MLTSHGTLAFAVSYGEAKASKGGFGAAQNVNKLQKRVPQATVIEN